MTGKVKLHNLFTTFIPSLKHDAPSYVWNYFYWNCVLIEIFLEEKHYSWNMGHKHFPSYAQKLWHIPSYAISYDVLIT